MRGRHVSDDPDGAQPLRSIPFPLTSLAEILRQAGWVGADGNENLRNAPGIGPIAVHPEKDRNDHGFASLPFVLLFGILASGALTLLAVQVQFRAKVATQLRLDRCVSAHGAELARKLNAIEQGNTLIRAARVAALAGGALNPAAALKACQTVTRIIAAKQDLERLDWQATQARWILKRGCDGVRDLLLPLPSIMGSRLPSDLLGEQPFLLSQRPHFRIRLWRENLHSSARVEKPREVENARKTMEWSAHWEPGPGLL